MPLSNNLRQLAAGFYETYGSSPAARQEMPLGLGYIVPNSVWQLSSLVTDLVPYAAGSVYDAVREKITGQAQPERVIDNPSTFLRYAISGIDQANEALDTTDPRNTIEQAYRVGGSMLLPLPWNATRVATSAAPSMLTKAARGLAAVILPGTQSTTLLGAGAEALVGTAVADVVQDVVDPMYQSAVESYVLRDQYPLQRSETGVDVETTYNLSSGDVLYRAMQAANDQAGVNLSEPLLEVDMSNPDSMINAGILTEDNSVDAERARSINKWLLGAAIVAGGTAASAALARYKAAQMHEASYLYGPSGVSRRRSMHTERGQPSLAREFGAGFSPDTATALTAADITATQTLDRLHPLHRYISEAVDQGKLSVSDAATMTARIKTIGNQSAFSVAATDFGRSGQFPQSTRSTKVLGYLLERYAQLPATEQALVYDKLAAGTVLDDMIDSGINTWGDPTLGQTFSRAELESIDQFKASPRVMSLVEDMRQFFRDFATWSHEQGYIDNATLARWQNKSPRYVPLRFGEGGRDFGATDFGMERNQLNQGVLPGQVVNPLELSPEYTTRMLRAVMNNRLRRELLDVYRNITIGDGTPGKPRRRLVVDVTKAAPATRHAEDVVTVYDGGQARYFKVNDFWVRESLKLGIPVHNAFVNAMAQVARVQRYMTTGPLAPWFVWKGIGYNTITSFLNHPDGRRISNTGQLIEAVSNGGMKMRGLDLEERSLPDPGVALNPIVGTLQGIFSNAMYYGARKLDAAIMNDGLLTNTLGRRNTQTLQGIMENAFLNATKRNYERLGGGTAPLYGDHPDHLPRIVAEISPKFARSEGRLSISANPAWRAYRAVLDSIHASNHTAAFGANVPKEFRVTQHIINGRPRTVIEINQFNGMSQDDLRGVVADIREIAGDPGRSGGMPGTPAGQVTSAYMRNTIYVNIAVQALARLGRQFKERPTHAIGAVAALTLGSVGYIHSQISDPKKRDEYLKLSPSQRGRFVPIFNEDGSWELNVAIPHEARPIYSAVLEASLAMRGVLGGPPEESPYATALDAAWSRVYQDLLPQVIPNYVAIGAAGVTGQRIPNPNYGSFDFVAPPIDKLFESADEGEIRNHILAATAELFVGAATAVYGAAEAVYNIIKYDTGPTDWTKAWNAVNDWLEIGAVERGSPMAQLYPEARRMDIKLTTADDPYAQAYHRSMEKITTWNDLFESHMIHPAHRGAQLERGEQIHAQPLGEFVDKRETLIAANLRSLLFDSNSPFARQLTEIKSGLNDLRAQEEVAKRQFSDPAEQRRALNEITAQKRAKYIEGYHLLQHVEMLMRSTVPDFEGWREMPSSPQIPHFRDTSIFTPPRQDGTFLR